MSALEHSPEPWEVHKSGEYLDVVAADKTIVASFDPAEGGESERGNAYLSAAAPELLAMAQLLVRGGRFDECLDLARATIAKAGGK